jgi:hypothetical protein
MSVNNPFHLHVFQRRAALVMFGLLAAWPVASNAGGDGSPTAERAAAVGITAVVVPPAPRLMARTAGATVVIEADLPPTVKSCCALVPTGEGQWTIVLATYDGMVLATYHYPLSIGSLPIPPPPSPQPEPTPVPPISSLAKVALDAARRGKPRHTDFLTQTSSDVRRVMRVAGWA